QAHHFMKFAPVKVDYGIERYGKETKRLYGVLDARLAKVPYLAGDAYSVADMATYPWVARHDYHQVDLAAFPNVKRWYDSLSARPAVRKGMAVP
ncbi:MAG: glutathione binding-like protein, partial [Tagaea sp.]